MYYYTSHHHPIPYYIAIIVPHCRRTRTDIHAYMHISRGTLSIRSSVISFLSLPVSTTSILSISYHYNTQRFSQVSSIVQFLSFVFCVFPFRIRSENLLAIEIMEVSEVRLSGMQGSSSSTLTAWSLDGECEGQNERMHESISISSRNRWLRSSNQCNLEERQGEATERRYTVKFYLTLGPAITYSMVPVSVNHDDRLPYGQLFLPKSSSLRGTGRKYSRVSSPPSHSYDGERKS